MKRFIEAVGKNGFLASLLVRLVPTAPFIVVNMAAGVTAMRFASFVAGTAIGIVPKIALTAFAGNAVVAALNGGGAGAGSRLGVIAVIWIGSVLVRAGPGGGRRPRPGRGRPCLTPSPQ